MGIKHLFACLAVLLFVSACTKISATEIGTGLIPSVDGVITKDTNITILARNWTDIDTARPSLGDDHALGYVNDPLFGTTSAAINVQMEPLSFPFSFTSYGSALTLDSVVLALDVRGSWGDTTQPLALHVKEIDNNQTFIADTSYIIYNSTSQFSATNDLTYNGVASVDPRTLNDSFHVYQDSGVNMLRIRLADDFGNRLLHTYDTTNQYKSDSLFKLAFKGFQISADPAGNALLKIGLAATSSGVITGAEANTKLALYYKTKTTTGTDTSIVSYFTINIANNGHTNYIKRDVTKGQAGKYFPTDTTGSGNRNDDFIYVQSSPGTKALLTIDSAALGRLPNWIIHRAEIVMEQAPDQSSSVLDNFTSPYLFLLAKENDTSFFNIPGFDPTSLNASDAIFSSGVITNYSDFGGFPLRKNNVQGQSINYYDFNISRYIQGLLTKKNPQFRLVLYAPYKEYFKVIKDVQSYVRVATTPLNSAAVGRVRLFGGGDYIAEPRRMKLHIVYSIPH